MSKDEIIHIDLRLTGPEFKMLQKIVQAHYTSPLYDCGDMKDVERYNSIHSKMMEIQTRIDFFGGLQNVKAPDQTK